MDAFFASVEQRDFPELRGKPIAVGGGERGVVSAASYEARKFGVHSAMSSALAKKKCPDLIFVPHRFTVYKAVSDQILAIFQQYSDFVQPLSLDEAFLDITANKAQISSARTTALAIKNAIYEQTQLTASAGVSFNKFLAKIASDLNKPNGIAVITPAKAPAFIDQLPIGKIFGIGKVTEIKMQEQGIFTGADLKKMSLFELVQKFGKSGKHYYQMVHLLDDRPVQNIHKRKSIGTETTFLIDITSLGICAMHIQNLAKKVSQILIKKNEKAKTITIKIKYNDFSLKTRSKTINQFTNAEQKIIAHCKTLLKQEECTKPIRLLGVSVSNFESEKTLLNQQQLFDF